MDFVSLPTRPTRPHQRVALVGIRYDGGDFLTYPLRAGETWRHVIQGEGQASFQWYEYNKPTDDALLEPFFQTWLFFGLLHEVLDSFQLYQYDDYIDEDHDGQFVTMRRFPDHLRAWATRVREMEEVEKEALRQRLEKCLLLQFTVLRALWTQPGNPLVGHPDFNRPLRDSILCLAAVITGAMEQSLDALSSEMGTNFELYGGFTADEKAIMVENGWCPSIVSLEDYTFSSITYRQYIKSLGMPDVGQDHSECTELACTSEVIDPLTYTAVHTTPDCKCTMLGASQHAVEQCLLAGTYPVMAVSGEALDDLSIEVVPYHKDVKYVALSHVWADGLGNPSANDLPRCQLLGLKRRIDALEAAPGAWREANEEALEGKLYFWCDTLLVPVQVKSELAVEQSVQDSGSDLKISSSQQLWTLAMGHMRAVYEQAILVLVLDRTLEAVSVAEVGTLEANIRLHSSRYTRRLWTYQEGALAERFVIQFKDQALWIRPLQHVCKDLRSHNPLLRDLASSVAARNGQLRQLKGLKDYGVNLLSLDVAVRGRNASHAEDEPLCASTILDLKLATVAEGKGRLERWQRFWHAMPHQTYGIADNIVFNDFPRLNEVPGLHWAPSTFNRELNERRYFLINPDTAQNAELLPGIGLRIHSPGYRIRFCASIQLFTKLHWLMRDSVKQGLLHIKLPTGSWATLNTVKNGLPGNAKTVQTLFEEQPGKQWYLIQHKDTLFDQVGSHYCVLATSEQHESGLILFESQTLVTINPLDSSWNTMMLAAGKHALTASRHSSLTKLYWWTLLDNLAGMTANLLPTFIRSRIAKPLARYIVKRQEGYMVECWRHINSLSEYGAQEPGVKYALDEITGPQPGGFTMNAHITMQFIGDVAVAEEVYSVDHEWIVG